MTALHTKAAWQKPATYADLDAVSPLLVAEIIDGALVTHPRPSPRHGAAVSALGVNLGVAFQFGRTGPGGWVFIVEPELHFGEQVVVPDLAGWRLERLHGMPNRAYIEISPDWICEVLSPSTERHDRGAKRRIYAEAGVKHLWHLDPRYQLLEVFALTGEQWLLAGTWSSDDEVRAVPFDAIAFSLAGLWPLDKPLGFAEDPQALFAGDR